MQCAVSLWEFRYSEYWKYPPGQRARNLPKFFDQINEFHCVNLTSNRKQLKLTTDLATPEQQNNLGYLLDIFPGLYCQRVELENFLPPLTISQPVILVAFATPAAPSTSTSDNRARSTQTTKNTAIETTGHRRNISLEPGIAGDDRRRSRTPSTGRAPSFVGEVFGFMAGKDSK